MIPYIAAPGTAPLESPTPGPAAPHIRPRRTPVKPTTPGSASNGHGTYGLPKQRSLSSDQKRSKPTLTSSMNFPQDPAELAPFPAAANDDGEELGRAARRSKVEAISRIDRVGTPVQLTAGPTATSFVPAASSTSAQPSSAGPSVTKNPLHRPAVHNPPFNIDSVRTEAPRYPPSRSHTRLFGLEECPTYYPTAEQFQDCMAYIESISDEAKPYGICKIVPPEGWRMPFVLDTDKFRFKTRLQRLNSLEAASRAKINFLEQLQLYLEQGDSKLHIPVIDRRPLDLYGLRKAVAKIGGHDEVNRMGGWGIVAKTLGYDERYALTIKSAYMRIILPFDTFANGGKAASESPLTPMPSTMASKPPGFANESPASPTRRSGRMSGVGSRGPPPPPSFAKRGESSRSASPPIKPFQLPSGPVRDLPPFEPSEKPESSASSSTTLRIKVPGFSSRDGSESELSDEDPVPVRKAKAVVHTPYQKGEVCEVCRLGHDAPKILLCDSCDKGFHTYCLNPPLSFVPANEEWYCGPCIFAQGDGYGFDEGEDHSIPSFQARDKAFANHWWSKHPMRSATSEITRTFGDSIVSEDDVEREFWRLTEDPNDTVEIEYGADVHSTTHGSGSPSLETHPLNKYSKDGWNLNNMPILSESLLRYIRSDISGMTVPWIYVGMMLSAFCWHNEDHYTYSVNYMHWGETKTWYGIPGADAEKFEETMKSEAPELFEQEPSLLYQLVTMMNPGRISEAGVKVVACDQRPNEFVITFPKAYHCGFNHGINFNEAVNFALPDWLAAGKEAVLRYKMHAKAPVFSHNELLISITLYSETIRTAIWLQDALKEMVADETARREQLRIKVPLINEQLVEEDLTEEQYQCCTCKGFCYLSQIVCSCTKLVACVEHADTLCACPPARRSLRKRYSEAQLEEICDIVSNRASLPENWRAKFDHLLEVPRPPLKSMRALLNDGEKIAHPIPEIHDLRAVVDRANDWVERVTALLTRKGAGRKKRKQTGHDEEGGDRNLDTLQALLREAERLAFDSPEIITLRQMLMSIESFKSEAASIMGAADSDLDLEKCRTTLILGNSLGIDIPELAAIQTTVNRLEWFIKLDEEVDDRTLQYEDVVSLLEEAEECEVPVDHPTVVELRKREAAGKEWKDAVEHLFRAESIEIRQISELIEGKELIPTSIATMRELEAMRRQALTWQSTASAQFGGQGSSATAARLVKAVRTARGPLGKINIPELAELQAELDFHDRWRQELATTLYVEPKEVPKTVNNLLAVFEQHFQPEDDLPTPHIVCFCRTPPGPSMVQCGICMGDYHPKCVGVAAKNLDKPFTCSMCSQGSPDDRPSLDSVSHFSTTDRQRFRIVPAEVDILTKVTDIAIENARTLVSIVDPLGSAVVCRDFELLAHWHRKLFNLPVTFDARNTNTKQRIVFEEWLYKRMMEAKHPVKQTKTRPRKPKIVLRQAREGQFSCICSIPPNDALVTISCVKCRQGYHASCVRAPAECLGPEGKNWRCPCCTVKEAKRLQQGDVAVRVQNSDRLGSNVYIDYRTTINTYASGILEYLLPPADCITLECIRFVEPIIPEGFTPPTIEEVRATRHNDNNDDLEDGRKTKKRKVETAAPGTNGLNGTPPAQPIVNGGAPVNGYGHTAGHALSHSYTPMQASASATKSATHTPQQTPSSAASDTQVKSLTASSAAYPSPISLNQSRTTVDQSGAHRPGNHPFGGYPGMSSYGGANSGSVGGAGVATTANGSVRAGAASYPYAALPGPVQQLTNGLSRANAIDLASSDQEM